MTAEADRLFVTKVPQQATKDDVSAYFARFGTTTDVYVPFVPGSIGHKGIAFVSFSEPAAVQLALTHGPHELCGSEILLDIAAPKGYLPGQVKQHAHGPAAGGEQEGQGDRLFVTKIPPNLLRDQMFDYFQAFGELADCYMPMVPGGDRHKGICFVSFVDAVSASAALQFTTHEIQGHQVVVDAAAPRGAQKAGGKGAAPTSRPVFHATQGALPPSAIGKGTAKGVARSVPAPTRPFGAQQQKGTGTPVPGRLFLTRVDPEILREDLQMYFQQFGDLTDVFVPSGNKGIAFVTFSDPAVAHRVLSHGEHMVKVGQAQVVVDQAYDKGKGKGKGVVAGGAPVGGYTATRQRPY